MTPAPRTLGRARIAGTGAALPERVVTNDDLAKLVATDDAWIRTRTGIGARRVVSLEPAGSPRRARTPTLDLALEASRRALDAAGVAPPETDLVIVATCTPDYPGFPATAPVLVRRLGAGAAAAFDISLACTGFIAALVTARAYIASGAARTVLAVGVDVMSGIIDWTDRNTCIIFGDGAGAAVLRAVPDEGDAPARGEVLFGALSSEGSEDLLNVDIEKRVVRMKGRETFKFAVQSFVHEIERAAARVGARPSDLAWIVPHQVNRRVIEAATERLALPIERVVVNIDRVGNTSAGSVPAALDEAARDGRLRPGDLVCLVAFGAGLASGASVIRW
jgi:3-oxoacyl-[acyl-carrier-protein] synthase-3